MAKSLRSKWRRKMRNIKRERYGKKELIRLKKMLGLPTDEEESTVAPGGDVIMNFSAEPEKAETEPKTELSAREKRRIRGMVREGSDREDSEAEKEIDDIIVMTTSRKLRKSYRKKEQKEAEMEKEQKKAKTEKVISAFEKTNQAESMDHDQKRVFNAKTMRDQYGNYPVWMNQKRMRTLAKANRKTKKKDLKRLRKRTQTQGRVTRSTKDTKVGDDHAMDTETITVA